MKDVDLLQKPFTGYLASKDYPQNLETEISGADIIIDRLYLKEGPSLSPAWAQNIWLDPLIIEYDSISDAVRKLKAIQRNWALLPNILHRRAQLIKDALPHIGEKPKSFPYPLPALPMGSFTLIDEHRLIASPSCASPFAHGEIEFEENKLDPPSRAYLKLQEALCVCGSLPGPQSRCIDAGACPGGWTWVLTLLGAHVTAIDRSELDPRLMAHPLVNFSRHSAFTLKPEELGACDWLFSDVICYPAKLYEWILVWLNSGLCRNFICTVKMQGEPDWETMAKFKAIPGSRLLHLGYNKHELTWMLLQGDNASGAKSAPPQV